jgi:hypothetical protein
VWSTTAEWRHATIDADAATKSRSTAAGAPSHIKLVMAAASIGKIDAIAETP